MKNIGEVMYLTHHNLIYGLGISLVDPSTDFIYAIKDFPNAVVHVINGIVTVESLKKLKDNNIKVLILGYKELRRGQYYISEHLPSVLFNKKALKQVLPNIIKDGWFSVVSFDNLAIEQLGVKELLSEEEWNEFYAGDDGTVTYYIDMVKKQFAVSSTSPFEERYHLLDNVDDMFKFIQILNKLKKKNSEGIL